MIDGQVVIFHDSLSVGTVFFSGFRRDYTVGRKFGEFWQGAVGTWDSSGRILD